MAFVDDQLAVAARKRRRIVVPRERLNEREVGRTRQDGLAAAVDPDRLRGVPQRRGGSRAALAQQVLSRWTSTGVLVPQAAMTAVTATVLAELGRGDKHAGLVREHDPKFGLLIGSQDACEREL